MLQLEMLILFERQYKNNLISGEKMRTWNPKKINSVLCNPGCGMMYLQRGANKIRYDQIPKDAWFLKEKLTDKIAFSVPWQVIEPEEGKFNWKHPDWEGCIDSWIDAGFKVALEVRGMDAWGTCYGQGVPQWVFDAGAKYVDESLDYYRGSYVLNFLDFEHSTAPVRYPVYWDKIYLEKVRNLVQAMGERYNGRPEIEWINQGHMGRWGEMHISMHSPLQPWFDAGFSRETYVDAMFQLIDIYCEAFPDTRLCQEICTPVFGEVLGTDYLSADKVPEVYARLAERGFIIKQNGIGKAWHGTRSRYIDQHTLELFEQYYRQTPVACENLVLKEALEEAMYTGHISYWHSGGEKEGLHIMEHEKAIPLPEKKVWSYTTFFPEEYAKMTVEDEKNIWRMMARHCGYRLEIEKITVDGPIVTIQWNNSGSAPCYEKLHLELEAVKDGKTVSRLYCPVLADGIEKYRMPYDVPDDAELRLKLTTARGAIALGIEGADSERRYKFC